MEPKTTYIGIAVCEWCDTRYRLKAQHASFEGQKTRCVRCHRDFEIYLIRPSSLERAAIETSSSEPSKRKRRSQDEIRAEHHQRVRDSFRTHHKRLISIRDAERSSEEEVRRWCIDALRQALGYEDCELDTEMRSLNKRVDIAMKWDGKVRMVVECKNIRSRLPDSAREQAAGYAINHGAEWAVVTNGQVWKLFHVEPRKGQEPELFEVFDVALLDEDGVSDADVEMLYLISKRAQESGDTSKAYHRARCCSERSLLRAMASERVTRAIRRQLTDAYAEESGENIRLGDEETYDLVRNLFLPPEL